MTVAQLMERLTCCEPDRLVIISSDAEGNSHAPVYSTWKGKYKDGEPGLEELTKEDVDYGYTEEDLMLDGEKAIFLCP